MFGYVDATTIAVGGNKGDEEGKVGELAKLCFGSGDAFGRAVENYQLTLNGQSISNPRQSAYRQVLDRVWFTEQVFTKRWSSCGGRQDQYDSVVCSGEAHNRGAGKAVSAQVAKAAANTSIGIPAVTCFTGDSGIASRVDGLMSCITSLPAPGAAAGNEQSFTAANGDCKYITVRWPCRGVGVFSPITARDEVSATCPYRYSSLAIPHVSVCQLDILFEGLKEALFRNLSSRGGAAGDQTMANNVAVGGFEIALSRSVKPKLCVEYLRLSSWRPQPERVNLQTFRIAVINPTSMTGGSTALPETLTRAGISDLGGVDASGGVKTVGVSGFDRQAGQSREAQFTETGKMLDVKWNGVVSSQPPAMLAFCMQKSNKQFLLEQDAFNQGINSWEMAAAVQNGAAVLGIGRGEVGGMQNYFLSHNTDSAAAILQVELQVQSSIGSYSYSGDTFPYQRTRHQLWRDHLKSACEGYCAGDIEKWHRHQCIMCIQASDYLRGISSPGVSYPITINAQVKFISRREYIDGTGGVSANSRGTPVFQDKIAGAPVMLQFFPQQSLQLSASSGLLSSQNLSHASAQQILSQY